MSSLIISSTRSFTAAVASTSPLEASFVSCEMTAAYTFAFLVSGLVSSRS